MLFKKLKLATISVMAIAFASPAIADCYPSEGCWGAVAQALWTDYEGRARVSVGVIIDVASEGDAHQGARNSCEKNSQGTICTVAGTFGWGGCGYITAGVRETRVRWTTGSTAEEAYSQCTSGGYDCDWPIGGCTSR